jgi:hypothetical protein
LNNDNNDNYENNENNENNDNNKDITIMIFCIVMKNNVLIFQRSKDLPLNFALSVSELRC